MDQPEQDTQDIQTIETIEPQQNTAELGIKRSSAEIGKLMEALSYEEANRRFEQLSPW